MGARVSEALRAPVPTSRLFLPLLSGLCGADRDTRSQEQSSKYDVNETCLVLTTLLVLVIVNI